MSSWVTVQTWLEGSDQQGKKRVVEMAELIIKNGGRILIDPNRLGILLMGSSPLGQLGISVVEALRLSFMAGQLEGLLFGADEGTIKMSQGTLDAACKAIMQAWQQKQARQTQALKQGSGIVGPDGKNLTGLDS